MAFRFLMAAVSAFGVSACGDAPDIAAPASQSAATTTLLPGPTSVAVVTRDTPLATSLSASKVIGVLGGTISLPGAGVTVIVPALAVLVPTQITVTAIAGSQVAYEFEPHGTTFAMPLLVRQSLTGTSAGGSVLPANLYGGYFADASVLDAIAGTGLVTELLSATINPWTRTATFAVTHFSGYLLATGESGDGDGSQ